MVRVLLNVRVMNERPRPTNLPPAGTRPLEVDRAVPSSRAPARPAGPEAPGRPRLIYEAHTTTISLTSADFGASYNGRPPARAVKVLAPPPPTQLIPINPNPLRDEDSVLDELIAVQRSLPARLERAHLLLRRRLRALGWWTGLEVGTRIGRLAVVLRRELARVRADCAVLHARVARSARPRIAALTRLVPPERSDTTRLPARKVPETGHRLIARELTALRTKPSLGGKVTRQVPAGTRLLVFAREGEGWFLVQHEDGEVGFVPARDLVV